MACNRCGRQTPRTRLCKQCARDDRHSTGPVGGTSADSDDDGDEWAVEQQGLDGEAHEGQATLTGGVCKDGSDSDD